LFCFGFLVGFMLSLMEIEHVGIPFNDNGIEKRIKV
jgi:hypothetical protein